MSPQEEARRLQEKLNALSKTKREKLSVFVCDLCLEVLVGNLDVCSGCGSEISPRSANYDQDIERSMGENHLVDAKTRTWTALVEEAEVRGFHPGWAAHRFHEKWGEWPSNDIRSVATKQFGAEPEDDRRRFYVEQLVVANERGYKLGWAAHRYKDKYGVFPPAEFRAA